MVSKGNQQIGGFHFWGFIPRRCSDTRQIRHWHHDFSGLTTLPGSMNFTMKVKSPLNGGLKRTSPMFSPLRSNRQTDPTFVKPRETCQQIPGGFPWSHGCPPKQKASGQMNTPVKIQAFAVGGAFLSGWGGGAASTVLWRVAKSISHQLSEALVSDSLPQRKPFGFHGFLGDALFDLAVLHRSPLITHALPSRSRSLATRLGGLHRQGVAHGVAGAAAQRRRRGARAAAGGHDLRARGSHGVGTPRGGILPLGPLKDGYM